jgi:16S rRNA (guanine527-N7)-methyltransferase
MIREMINNYFSAMDIKVSKTMVDKFYIYLKMLQEYNNKINLTAITDDREIIIKHFIDSLSCLETNKFGQGCSVVDIGTGAGFPGIPIKIVRPDIKITLIDSLNKRILFLKEAVKVLNLESVSVLHSRAEDAGNDKSYREKFDIAVSRAVANLSVLSEYCLPLVKVGGYFISMKGPDIKHEIEQSNNAISTLGGTVEGIKSIALSEIEAKHSLVIIKKEKKSPTKFPRKAGKPSKDPIS